MGGKSYKRHVGILEKAAFHFGFENLLVLSWKWWGGPKHEGKQGRGNMTKIHCAYAYSSQIQKTF